MSLHPVLQVTKAYRAGKHRFTTVGAYSQLDDPLYDQVDNVEVDTMSITAGNVGIGTTLPAHKLHVEGDIYANGTMMASNLQILGEFVTMNTLTSNTEQMIIRNEGTGPALQVTQTGPTPIADFYDDDNVLVLRIADGANVGIGTSLPRSKLDVIGTGIYSSSIGIGTTEVRKALDIIGETIISANLGIGTATPRHALDIIGNAIVSSALGIGTTVPRLHTQLDVVGNAFFQANVGIGTDTPSVKFEVDGSVIARSNLIVGQATTTGYQSIVPNGDDLIVAGRIAVAGTDGSTIYKLGVGYAPPTQGEGTVILSANLGIGTTQPRTTLDIASGSALLGNIGIGTTIAPEIPISVYDTTAILLPKGSNSERPLTPQTGYIRYNTDTQQFEGFGAGNVWGSLGGVKSTDQLTYITAELNAGTNDCNLRFFTSGQQQAILNPYGNLGIGTTTPTSKLHVEGNLYANGSITASNLYILGESVTLNTVTSNTERIVVKNDGTGPALQVIQTGAEPVAEFYDQESGVTLYIGNDGLIGIGTALPTVSLTFNETDAILLPKGSTLERPSPGVQGYIRYNSETLQFEGFGAGDVWGSLGGVKSTDQLTYISAESNAGANDSNLRFYTSGVQRAIISPSGNIGIGTTNPLFKLDVEGTTFTEELRTSNLTVYGISHFEMNSSTLRSRVQITPIRQMFYVTTPTQSNFLLQFTGVYSASPSNVMVFVGQTPQFYYSPTVKDYDLSITYVNNPPVHVTEYTISLTSPAIYGDIVDITIWPQLIQESAEEQGYVLQSVFVSETNWGKDTQSNIYYTLGNIGIGTTAPTQKLDIHGNLQITGDILPSQCNVFDIGSSNYRFRDIFLSGNTIDLGGTRLTRDQGTGGLKIEGVSGQKVDTTVKSLYTTENVGIGTTIATHPLTVYGNIWSTGTLRASNLEVFGDTVTLNTVTSNSEQLVVTNSGTGPALKVTQTGAHPIADFYDDSDVLVMRVANGGNVGIGTTHPQEKLYVQGNILASGDIGAYSDMRLKKDLQRIEMASDRLNALRAYSYVMKDDPEEKRRIGFVAQEVKEVVPEVVNEHTDGYLSITYGNLTALIVEAIQEIRLEINSMKKQISDMMGDGEKM